MERYFSDEYLDSLLLKEGLSAHEIEILISLAQNPFSPAQNPQNMDNKESLFASGIYRNAGEVQKGVDGLLTKGIVRDVHWVNDVFYQLSEWVNIEGYFSSSKKKNKILKKLKELSASSDNALYGTILNPALKAHRASNFTSKFKYLFKRFDDMLPEVQINTMCKCNLNCAYCCNQKKTKYQPFEQIEKEIYNVKSLGGVYRMLYLMAVNLQ